MSKAKDEYYKYKEDYYTLADLDNILKSSECYIEELEKENNEMLKALKDILQKYYKYHSSQAVKKEPVCFMEMLDMTEIEVVIEKITGGKSQMSKAKEEFENISVPVFDHDMKIIENYVKELEEQNEIFLRELKIIFSHLRGCTYYDSSRLEMMLKGLKNE